jgi:hypothetical protein
VFGVAFSPDSNRRRLPVRMGLSDFICEMDELIDLILAG